MTKPRTDFTPGPPLSPAYDGHDAPPRTGEFTAMLHAARGGYFYLWTQRGSRLMSGAAVAQLRGVQKLIEQGRLWLARRAP